MLCAYVWHFADAAKRLEGAGADFIVIATNTMHKLVPQIEEKINIQESNNNIKENNEENFINIDKILLLKEIQIHIVEIHII